MERKTQIRFQGGRYWLTVLLCFLLVLWRAHLRLNDAELWAEDGALFVPQALKYGWLSLFWPYAGSYHTVQRLIALLWIQLAPITRLAWGVTLSYFVLFALIVAAFSRDTYRWLISSDALRIAVSLTLCFAPGLNEMMGTLANLNWVLFFWLALLALKNPDEAIALWEYLFAFFILLSIGTGILLLPILALRLWVAISKPLPRYRVRQEMLLLSFVVVQVIWLWMIKEKRFAQMPSDPVAVIHLVFKSGFDSFLFQPIFGDKLAFKLALPKYHVWRRILEGILSLALVLWVLWQRKNVRVQFLVALSFGILWWPALCCIARPGVAWAFERPLDDWFTQMRYSFPTAVVAVIFWSVVFYYAFGKRRGALLLVLAGLFWNVMASQYRRVIPRFGSEVRWPHLAEQIEKSKQASHPDAVSGQIYPDGWVFNYSPSEVGKRQ